MTIVSQALDMRDVVVEYRRKHQANVRAVAGVNLTLETGEILGLVGESGCGKSTLAKAIVGLVPTAEGSITFAGRPVEALARGVNPPEQRRLQMIFQDPHSSLNPRRTIGKQIGDFLTLGVGMPKVQHAERVHELLESVNLPASSARAYPHQFSGGQRQRICIARALAAEPTVLVADEPISALDASAQAFIAQFLMRLNRESGTSILFISHDLSIVREIADRVAVMYLGKIVEVGTPEDIWNHPLHPYTRALVRAVPLPDGRGTMPDMLEGEVPDPAAPPAGCRFNTRCPDVWGQCAQEPTLIRMDDQRSVACWLHRSSGDSDLTPHRAT